MAVVGIGGQVDTGHRHWDMTADLIGFSSLESQDAVGEICCRFFNKKGDMVYQHLQNRTIAISLEI